MQGDIVFVDYELSSWKYMSYDRTDEKDLDCYKIPDINGIKHDIMSAYMVSAGGGSAYGGKWRPAKTEDERLVGNPGEIKRTIDRNGNRIDTKIGQNGFAEKERHYTNHGFPAKHSDIHDHIITWNNNRPDFDILVNYWDHIIPDFKSSGGIGMNENYTYLCNSLEQNRFKTISEFKLAIECGAEIEFQWKGIHFGMVRYGIDNKITAYLWNQSDTAQAFDSADDALEYVVGGDRLRDVITQVTVLGRTI